MLIGIWQAVLLSGLNLRMVAVHSTIRSLGIGILLYHIIYMYNKPHIVVLK